MEGGILNFMGLLIDFMAKLAGTVAFFALVVGGIMMIIGGGNDELLNKSKAILKYSIIGLALSFGAYVIVTFVRDMIYHAT
jgi:hypothetical protein